MTAQPRSTRISILTPSTKRRITLTIRYDSANPSQFKLRESVWSSTKHQPHQKKLTTGTAILRPGARAKAYLGNNRILGLSPLTCTNVVPSDSLKHQPGCIVPPLQNPHMFFRSTRGCSVVAITRHLQ
ncbi:hypothetical protein PGTUg99_030777 [Puccinia graminis f. sp. tritici]|uniref:Uncharacterized protein n=1 Tax=Puccinia graminis f. sp. tritici TaxID=56615 RepID=A0A5B0S228_PUCGR|nr:hypothetical protein PGTUg99_030777 [Puccinia graminis f. sp. tritici]